MGNFVGHVLPGCFFITFSFWWFVNILYNSFVQQTLLRSKRRNERGFNTVNNEKVECVLSHSTTWLKCPCRRLKRFPVEPVVKAICCIVGIAGELTWGNWSLFNSHGHFSNLNNFAHATMFAAFLLVAFVEIFRHYNDSTSPSSVQHVMTSTAFGVEGLLFYYHIHGRNELDKKLHILRYSVIFAIAVTLLLEGWKRNNLILFTVRAFLVMLHGTWFIQVACVLYGSKPWKNTSSNQMFVTIAFTWHVLGLLLTWLSCFGLVAVLTRFNCCKNVSSKMLREQTMINTELNPLVSYDRLQEDTNS